MCTWFKGVIEGTRKQWSNLEGNYLQKEYIIPHIKDIVKNTKKQCFKREGNSKTKI